MKLPYLPDDHYRARIEKRLAITEYIEEFDPPAPDDVCIMGVYSRMWKNKAKRQVKTDKAVTVNGYKDSPTSHSRDYLRSCYEPRRCKKNQAEILLNRRMPLYARPCILLDACYVDIKSAWFSILSLVGWDCDYFPMKWFSRGNPPTDFPLKDNKVARSALVSLSRSSQVPVWREGGTKLEKIYNPVQNPHIYGVIADVLHCIAAAAVDYFNCVYVATDGFIVPSSRVEAFQSFISGWGLASSIKGNGNGFVLGPGSYYVGAMRTMHLFQSKKILDNINREVNIMWLLRRIEKC